MAGTWFRQGRLGQRLDDGGRLAESGSSNRSWSVPVTLVDARVGDAGVSGRVRE